MKPLYPITFIIAALSLLVAGCSKDENHNPSQESGTVWDAEGNVYRTVKIGDQWWMAENLKSLKFSDGTLIPVVSDSATWISLTTPGCCYYANDSLKNYKTYGVLYNWFSVNTGKLAPSGWHVATEADWDKLAEYLGGVEVAGGKMKEEGTFHWETPNTEADNNSGFTGLPGGTRLSFGNFVGLGRYGFWWSSDPDSLGLGFNRGLSYQAMRLFYDFSPPVNGYSVRCVQN